MFVDGSCSDGHRREVEIEAALTVNEFKERDIRSVVKVGSPKEKEGREGKERKRNESMQTPRAWA